MDNHKTGNKARTWCLLLRLKCQLNTSGDIFYFRDNLLIGYSGILLGTLLRVIIRKQGWLPIKMHFVWCVYMSEAKWRLLCSTSNKLLIYKTVLKPIWTSGIQLWGTASTSNIEILERFQSKALRMIVDAPWYVSNTLIRRNLQIPTVTEEIRRYSSQYSARLSAHPNDLIVNLMELPENRRLWRHLPNNLPTRFLVWLLNL
jgi:hypothetical protein